MNILDTIITQKKKEVAQRKQQTPTSALEKHDLFKKTPVSLKAGLKDASKTGIIAEFKRASPSKGIINDQAYLNDVVEAYAANGASGISILTDETFFKGHLNDLAEAAQAHVRVPFLRKDFMVDAYQLVEAKAYGASVILLIAACLSPTAVQILATTAKHLGLEVLLELHDEAELDHICTEVDMIGINNRNLKTFSVDLEQSIRLSEKIDPVFPKIAESGISQPDSIVYLKQHGFDGFLIGETFMKETNPGTAFRKFVTALNNVSI